MADILMGNSPEGIVLMDGRGNIIRTNESFIKIIGLSLKGSWEKTSSVILQLRLRKETKGGKESGGVLNL